MFAALAVASLIFLAGSLAPIWTVYGRSPTCGCPDPGSFWQVLRTLPKDAARSGDWREFVFLHAINIVVASGLWYSMVVFGRWTYRNLSRRADPAERPSPLSDLPRVDDRFSR